MKSAVAFLRRATPRLIIPTLLLLWAATAFVLLYSPYCMFTRLKMQINDYGTYVNFIWNTAHGEPFRYLMDENYLRTHLSVTLALLSPVYWMADHPFTLAVVQWACGVVGSLWMAWLAWRRGFSPLLVAMVLLFFLTYALTQSVLLCDFHGVCLYFVLFPWLYSELSKKRLLALAPLALIMGIREEAALLVVPMMLYVASARRWRTGYILAAAAFAYATIALTVIYPWVNGITLWERRANLLDGDSPVAPFWAGLCNRGIALFWLFLPAFPLLTRRTAWPIILFPLAALIIAMPSTNQFIHSLDKQYPAAPFTLLVLGMIEAMTARRTEMTDGRTSNHTALYLFACTIAAHFGVGHLLTGTRQTRDLMMPASPYGLTALHAASHLPKTGVLLTTSELSGICANRKDLLIFDRPHKRTDEVTIVFAASTLLFEREGLPWIARIRTGEFGSTYFDHNYSILTKGGPTNRNAELLLAHDNADRTIIFTQTVHHRGDLAYTRTWQGTRHWHGKGSFAPANISYGSSVPLEAGKWIALFRLKSKEPRKTVRGNWGLLELHANVNGPPIISAEIDHATAKTDEMSWQRIPFTLEKPTSVEIRATSGDAELWLDRVLFIPQPTAAR